MARRGRVTAKKSLGPGKHKRNVNPKLSPFQREQKRDRMANQPPVNLSKHDFPVHARGLQRFLEQQDEQRERKKRLREAHDGAGESNNNDDNNDHAEKEQQEEAAPQLKQRRTEGSNKARKRDGKGAVSLNAHMAEDDDIVARTSLAALEKKMLKKQKTKEKKRLKKRGIRADAAQAESAPAEPADTDFDREIGDLVADTRKENEERGIDEKLKMQDEHATAMAEKVAAEVERQEKRRRKLAKIEASLTEEEKLEIRNQLKADQENAEKFKGKPKDFEELFDVVRFGDRVEAPPVFDALPVSSSSLMPTQRVGKAKKQSEAEERRLVQLGLRKAPTQASAELARRQDLGELMKKNEFSERKVKGASLSSESDFAALRERVMQQYANKRQGSLFRRDKVMGALSA